MSRVHKKKRNVGLLYEFLVASVSRALVVGDKRASAKALRVIKKHFKPGTELYNEFRLLNSLARTNVSSEHVAASILAEAKSAARKRDAAVLDRQKSLLIRDINHVVSDPDFYDRQVNEYKKLATIQTLLNEWRSRDPDLSLVANYEQQLLEALVQKRDAREAPSEEAQRSPGEQRLLMKVMMKRLNERYSSSLTPEQKALVRAYAFSTASSDSSSIDLKLKEMREKLVQQLDSSASSLPEHVAKKAEEVRARLLTERVGDVDDAAVTRHMLYAKLSSELLSSTDEEETTDG